MIRHYCKPLRQACKQGGICGEPRSMVATVTKTYPTALYKRWAYHSQGALISADEVDGAAGQRS